MNNCIKAVLSRPQQEPGEGPEIYKPSRDQDLLALYSKFFWHHYDLTRYHQIVVSKINEQDNSLNKKYKKMKETYPENIQLDSNEGEEEYRNYLISLQLSNFHALDMELNSTKAFLNNFIVIGLWATVEQFISEILRVGEMKLLGAGKKNNKSTHIWSNTIERYKELGIELDKCKGFLDIDECRVLNNKIKHVGYVDERLSEFADFNELKNKALDCITYDLQRYSDTVFEFVGNVMEVVDLKILSEIDISPKKHLPETLNGVLDP